MPPKKKKANVRGNKGGCKVGRKGETPKGGCKVGKRDPNKTEKTAAMMAAFQASRKNKVAAAAKSKSAAAVGVKAGDKVKFKKKAKKSEPTEYKRKVKVGTSDRTTRSAPEAKGVMKDKAAKKARIQAKVRELGKAQIAKKKEKKKDFTAAPKKALAPKKSNTEIVMEARRKAGLAALGQKAPAKKKPSAPASASGGGGSGGIIPTTKQSDDDLKKQKLLKEYFKHNSPYGGGHYEVHGGKLYVEKYHFDTTKEQIDNPYGSDYGTEDWKRTIMGYDWGSGYGEKADSKYTPLRDLKMGAIGLKKRELLKGFKEYDVYSTSMGHDGLKERHKSPKRVESGLKFQKKGQQVFDMFGQKRNVDSNIRALYPVKGEKDVFNTFTGKEAKYGIKFRFVEGKGFVEI